MADASGARPSIDDPWAGVGDTGTGTGTGTGTSSGTGTSTGSGSSSSGSSATLTAEQKRRRLARARYWEAYLQLFDGDRKRALKFWSSKKVQSIVEWASERDNPMAVATFLSRIRSDDLNYAKTQEYKDDVNSVRAILRGLGFTAEQINTFKDLFDRAARDKLNEDSVLEAVRHSDLWKSMYGVNADPKKASAMRANYYDAYLQLFDGDKATADAKWNSAEVQAWVRDATNRVDPFSVDVFAAWVKQNDPAYGQTSSYARSEAEARKIIADLFPGIETTELDNLIVEYAKSGMTETEFRQRLQETDLWQSNYSYYDQSGLTDPDQYREYKESFERIMRSYGITPDESYIQSLFTKKVTPEQFSSNISTYLDRKKSVEQYSESYKWFTGGAAPTIPDEMSNILQGENVSEENKDQMSELKRAFSLRESALSGKLGQFDMSRNEFGQITQKI